jgi:hypothetical protein
MQAVTSDDDAEIVHSGSDRELSNGTDAGASVNGNESPELSDSVESVGASSGRKESPLTVSPNEAANVQEAVQEIGLVDVIASNEEYHDSGHSHTGSGRSVSRDSGSSVVVTIIIGRRCLDTPVVVIGFVRL